MRIETHFYGIVVGGIAAALAIGLLVPALAIPAGIALALGWAWYSYLCWRGRHNA
jgi:hypothetical protein